MRKYSLLLALAALIVVALPATSTTLTWYTNRAAWETAVGNTFSLIDFQGTTTGNYSTSAGVTIQDVQFTGKNASNGWFLWVSGNASPGPGILQPYLYTTGNTSGSGQTAYASAKFNNNAAYIAVGVNVNVANVNGSVAESFWVKDNVDNLWVQATHTTGFIGFISDVGVNQVWFASKSANGVANDLSLDNFVFSNGAPPPETPDLDTLILCGTGLSILSFVMRWRKRAKA